MGTPQSADDFDEVRLEDGSVEAQLFHLAAGVLKVNLSVPESA